MQPRPALVTQPHLRYTSIEDLWQAHLTGVARQVVGSVTTSSRNGDFHRRYRSAGTRSKFLSPPPRLIGIDPNSSISKPRWLHSTGVRGTSTTLPDLCRDL